MPIRARLDFVKPPHLVLVLSENWTMTPPRDLRGLVRIAVEAEAAGIDTVMLSEHVVLGPSSGANGIMGNPRDYAAPGNQDPATPWPDSMMLASAILASTTRLRVALAAIIAPLRHPLLLAKQLATLDLIGEGRLVVQPTVSWLEDEYAALGVPFRQRGAILDEQLEILELAWKPGPVSFSGQFFALGEVYVEPKPFRPTGPRMWFGGQSMHPALVRRIVRYGSGFHPFGPPSADDLARLSAAMHTAGRDLAELEMIGGVRTAFVDETSTASLDDAFSSVPAQLAEGYNSICFKPSMYTDDASEIGAICRRAVELAAAAAKDSA